MSSTPGALVRHYLTVAITEAGGAALVRDRDVQYELDAMVEGFDRQADRLMDVEKRLDELERRVELLEAFGRGALE